MATATDRPPIGSTVEVVAFRLGRSSQWLTGTVTRHVGDHTIEVTGATWSGLYAPEGVVVVEPPR